MALKKNIVWRGIKIPGVIYRIDHIYGGKREGWTAVIGMYQSEAQANPKPTEESEIVGKGEGGFPVVMMRTIPASPAPFDTIQLKAEWVAGEPPEVTIYNELKSTMPDATDV